MRIQAIVLTVGLGLLAVGNATACNVSVFPERRVGVGGVRLSFFLGCAQHEKKKA
jgi:hypothetical protein